MLRHDYGHLDCPFYEEKLENGLTVCFIPKSKSQLKSATLLISQGGFLHSNEIASSKIPFGSAYYLMNMILDEKTKKEFKKDGILIDSEIDYSYVSYSLNTLDDIYLGINKLFDRINNLNIKEADIEKFKETEKTTDKNRRLDPLFLTQDECLKNLYLSSPIRFGYLPRFEDGVRIHASALSKYKACYYNRNYMTLFISLDDDVVNVMKTLSKLKIGSKVNLDEKDVIYNEVYDKVNKEYTHATSPLIPNNYLSYGIKLPPRSIIYDSYGETTFTIYEILLKAIVSQNENFLNGLINVQSSLVDAKLKEGCEDTYIMLTFKTANETALIQFLTEYFLNLEKYTPSSQFYKLEDEIYTNSMKDLAIPSKVCYNFMHAYPNHIPYTQLIYKVTRLSYNAFSQFLKEFKGFKKACCIVKKG